MYGIVWGLTHLVWQPSKSRVPLDCGSFCVWSQESASPKRSTQRQRKRNSENPICYYKSRRERDDELWREWWSTGSRNWQKWSNVFLFTQQLTYTHTLDSSFMSVSFFFVSMNGCNSDDNFRCMVSSPWVLSSDPSASEWALVPVLEPDPLRLPDGQLTQEPLRTKCKRRV